MANVQNVVLGTSRTAGAKPDVLPALYQFSKEETPFLTLLNGNAIQGNSSPLSSRPVKSSGAFSWWEQEDVATYTTASAQHAASAGTINCTDATIFTYGDFVRVHTNPGGTAGEIMWVSAPVTSTTQITVGHATQGTSAAIIYSGAQLRRLGAGMPGSDIVRKGAVVSGRDEKTGYVQVDWVEVEHGLFAKSQVKYWGYEWNVDVLEAVRRAKKGAESTLWWNETASIASVTSTGTSPYYYRGSQTVNRLNSAGVNGIIQTNQFNMQTDCTYLAFCERIRHLIKLNTGGLSQIRWAAFMGSAMMGKLQDWPESYLQTSPIVNATWGWSVSKISVPGLGYDIPFIYTPNLDNGPMEDGFFLLNMAGEDTGDISLRYLVSGPPDNKNYNISALSRDGEDISPIGGMQSVQAWRWINGLQMRHERRHARFYNCC